MHNTGCTQCSGHDIAIQANANSIAQILADQRERWEQQTKTNALLFRKFDILQNEFKDFKVESTKEDRQIEKDLATYVSKWVVIATTAVKVIEVAITYIIGKL